jgi:hypothetical protein
VSATLSLREFLRRVTFLSLLNSLHHPQHELAQHQLSQRELPHPHLPPIHAFAHHITFDKNVLRLILELSDHSCDDFFYRQPGFSPTAPNAYIIAGI